MVKEESSKSASAARSQECENGMLDQLKLLHQHLVDENRQLRELLTARLADPARSAEDGALQRWEERRRAEAARLESELEAGPLRFQVSHPGDPTRTVGAADRTEAVEKYRRYFGILQTGHEFAAREGDEVTR